MAHALFPYFPNAHYATREDCDVTNPGQVRMTFQQTQPEVVIHCAAVTSHHADPMAYVMGNVQGTVNVLAQARKCGARLVYLGTDYLSARREEDPVSPIGFYAASKYAGELCIRPFANTLVIRGSWYSRLEYEYAATDAFTSKLAVDKAAFYVATLATSKHTGVVNIGGARRSIYEIALETDEGVIPCGRKQIACGYEIPGDCSLDTTRLNQWMRAA